MNAEGKRLSSEVIEVRCPRRPESRIEGPADGAATLACMVMLFLRSRG
jgi:hypothetical protein